MAVIGARICATMLAGKESDLRRVVLCLWFVILIGPACRRAERVSAPSSGSITGTTLEIDWEDGLAYCENLSWAGHDDWRLPQVKELLGVIDYAQEWPAVDTSIFPRTMNKQYLTSTNRLNNLFAEYVWAVR